MNLPIICETKGCPNEGEAFNVISGISSEYLEAFIEDWSRTNGAEEEDYCPICHERGNMLDPELPADEMPGQSAQK